MITLNISNLHWLGETPDEQRKDQCVHGTVEFRIRNTEFAKSPKFDLNLPTTGLFLLRTLDSDHSESHSVTDKANLLFAHCGHGIFPSEKSESGFVIVGCNQIADPKVVHRGASVTIKSESGVEEKVDADEWRQAVLKFANQVQAFYDSQPVRLPPEEDYERGAWQLFWKEWDTRITVA
jgi:hypothetical protein